MTQTTMLASQSSTFESQAMTQTTMLQKVVHLKVKPITLWSDHCEIQTELAIRKRSSLENTKPIKNSKVKIYRREIYQKTK